MKFSNAQILFFHALESAGFGIIASLVAGIYQYVNTNGLHWQGLLATGGLISVGHLSTAYKSLLANPTLPQAMNDTVKEIKAEVQGHTSLLNTLVGFLTNAPAPPSQPVQQVPFPSQQAQPIPSLPSGTMPWAAMPQPPKG